MTRFEALARRFARAIQTAKTPAERRAAYDGLMCARMNDPAYRARMARKRAQFCAKHGFPP